MASMRNQSVRPALPIKPTVRLFCAGLLFLAAGSAASAAAATDQAGRDSLNSPTEAGFDEPIEAAGLMRVVEFLAGPDLRGRLAGTDGYMAAARYAADRLRETGLVPTGDEGYFQNLTTETNEIESCALEIVRDDGTTLAFELGSDFLCRGLTGTGEIAAPVVFAGYGLSQPERNFDEYAGLDARGKIVLAFKEAPPFEADSAGWGQSWMPRPKGLVAAAHGAVGLLIVPRPDQEHPQRPIGSYLEGPGAHDPDFPRLQIDASVAGEFLRGSGTSLAELEAQIDSTRTPASRELNVSARVRARARYAGEAPSVNVIGRIEGRDPILRDEYVVLGAHLDHVGAQGGQLYFPGANDNASGAAAVLAIAASFAKGPAPRRSVIFGLWSAEESGLFGSERFVAAPPVPREKIVAYLNFDCVGHGDSIQVGGGRSYPSLWETARALDHEGLLIAETWNGGGADAAAFEEAGIPNLYFASHESYTHLHRPSDRPETLNPALLEAVARLGARTARVLAEADSIQP